MPTHSHHRDELLRRISSTSPPSGARRRRRHQHRRPSAGRRGVVWRSRRRRASLARRRLPRAKRPGLLQGHLARAQTRPVRSADGVRRRGPRLVGEGVPLRPRRGERRGREARVRRRARVARSEPTRRDAAPLPVARGRAHGAGGHLRVHGRGVAQRGDAREGSVRPGGRVASVVRVGGGERRGADGRLGRRARERALLRRHVQARQRAQPEGVPPRRARDRQVRARAGPDGPARVPVLRRLLRAEGGAGAMGGAIRARLPRGRRKRGGRAPGHRVQRRPGDALGRERRGGGGEAGGWG